MRPKWLLLWLLPQITNQHNNKASAMFFFWNHSEKGSSNRNHNDKKNSHAKVKNKKHLADLLAALSFEAPLEKNTRNHHHKKQSQQQQQQQQNPQQPPSCKTNKSLVPPSSLQSENSRALRKPRKEYCFRNRIVLGVSDPDGNGVEATFYDALEYGNGKTVDEFDTSSEEGSKEVLTLRAGHTESLTCTTITSTTKSSSSSAPSPFMSSSSLSSTCHEKQRSDTTWQPPLPPPKPPIELPERFLRAGKGDVEEGWRRYRTTLQWRHEMKLDTILRQPNQHFALIKQHYLHYFHLRGRHNEPCFYEIPAKTNLKALREGGVSVEDLLRHYAMIVEYQWQIVERDDFAKSLYIIDLQGIRFGDFMGDVMDFVKRASAFCNQHYPERAGTVYIINVPSWFKLIWNIVKPWVDPVTLEKIHILRGTEEIRQTMQQRIPLENLPPEYGGTSMPLGQSPEEKDIWELMEHNNRLAQCRTDIERLHVCGGMGKCRFCSIQIARSY